MTLAILKVVDYHRIRTAGRAEDPNEDPKGQTRDLVGQTRKQDFTRTFGSDRGVISRLQDWSRSVLLPAV